MIPIISCEDFSGCQFEQAAILGNAQDARAALFGKVTFSGF